jgi:hypothetical protein
MSPTGLGAILSYNLAWFMEDFKGSLCYIFEYAI